MPEKRESIALHMTCRTQKETLKLHMQASEFAMPKFFLEKFWVHTIEMLGCANLPSTKYGESSNKALKGAFRFTNKHNSQAIDAQVCLDTACICFIACCIKQVWQLLSPVSVWQFVQMAVSQLLLIRLVYCWAGSSCTRYHVQPTKSLVCGV